MISGKFLPTFRDMSVPSTSRRKPEITKLVIDIGVKQDTKGLFKDVAAGGWEAIYETR